MYGIRDNVVNRMAFKHPQVIFYPPSGHVFAFGESRALAIANMVLGLKEIQIRGEIRTNVDYSIDLLNVRILDMISD